MVKITFRTGCKFRFHRVIGRGQRVPWRLRVLQLCCWQSILVLFMDRGILFCTTKPARSIETRFVSRRFHVCITYSQHCCLVSQLIC